MSFFKRSGNNAITDNPDLVDQAKMTTHGSDWLWAVFAIMLVSDIVIFVWHFFIPRGQRVFHQLAILLISTAAIAYFSMASNLGYASIPVESGGNGAVFGQDRQIWYVRYIDWVITTPALLLELVLASGLPLSDIITLIFFDLVMIVTGLVGALVASHYKWGYFVFGCVAEFYIWWVLAGPARTSAGALGAEYKKSFTISAAILSFLWIGYPVAWAIADGRNIISTDSEMVFYGILDVLAKPVFCFIHLFLISGLDLSALQLQSGKFTSSGAGPMYDSEKQSRPRHAIVVENPPHTGPNGAVSYNPKKGKFSKKTRPEAVPTDGTRVSESTATSS